MKKRILREYLKNRGVKAKSTIEEPSSVKTKEIKTKKKKSDK